MVDGGRDDGEFAIDGAGTYAGLEAGLGVGVDVRGFEFSQRLLRSIGEEGFEDGGDGIMRFENDKAVFYKPSPLIFRAVSATEALRLFSERKCRASPADDNYREEPTMKTVRQTLIEEGRSAEEIEIVAEAYEEFGESIDEPPVIRTQRPMLDIARDFERLNRGKGIDY